MNALQKRLAQIGTEPHENGLCDGIVFEDAEDQCYWIYNHYSYCEWLKHYMMHYAGLSREEATEKLTQNSPHLKILRLCFVLHTSLPITTQWG